MNRTFVRTGLAAAAVALPLSLALTLTAAAQDRGPAPGVANRGPLAQFDTNADGAVTQAEIDSMRSDRLKLFDKNTDGKLSLEEYQALWLDAYSTEMVRAFQRHDADGDAAVTTQEFNRDFANIVARGDRNGDGKVDATDQARPPQAQAPQRGDNNGPAVRRPQPPQQPQGRGQPQQQGGGERRGL